MSFLKSYLLIFYLSYNFKFINAHQGVLQLKKVLKWSEDIIDFETETPAIEHYYNPVDEEWKKNKCANLGFTFQDPLVKRPLSSSVIPSDIKLSENRLYLCLAKIICHDRHIHHDLLKNNINNLKTNKALEELFDSKEQFELFIKETQINEEPVIPIEQDVEQCPLCYEDSTLLIAPCKHQICWQCAERYMYVHGKDTCPLCRSKIEFLPILRDNITPVNEYVELLAAAFYIDVCIYLYRADFDDWIFFYKGWPNYQSLDLKDEKCIYLYETENGIGIVTYVT